LDNSFNEKQTILTGQMQKIDDAIERANLVRERKLIFSSIMIFFLLLRF